MMSKLMEEYAGQNQVGKGPEREHGYRPISDDVVDYEFNPRRRSAAFPMVEA
jgi:hypothetical protein